jgi:mono/diheme cytochrome c family protein
VPRPTEIPPQEERSDAAEIRPEVEPDVERLHRAILREPRDPEEGREPVPWWVWTASVVVIFWAGLYLGRYGGTFDARAHVAIRRRDALAAGAAAGQARTLVADPVRAGQDVYTKSCQACHQADGMGLPGAFPPVRGSEWETGPPEQTVRIILDGMTGPISVAGQTFNGVMPAWRDQLSDAEMAAVATYVRQWRPNDAPPVDAALVARERAASAGRAGKPWTADELKATTAAAGTSAAPDEGSR